MAAWRRLVVVFGAVLAAAVAVMLPYRPPEVEPLLGRAYDSLTDSPLGGVEVSVWPVEPSEGFDPAAYDAESGPDGRFAVPIPKGLYPVRVYCRAVGYEPVQALAAGPGNLAVALVRCEPESSPAVLSPEPSDAGPFVEEP